MTGAWIASVQAAPLAATTITDRCVVGGRPWGYLIAEWVRSSHREACMGLDDKIDNKAEEAAGKAKEGVGKATDDESLEAEGKGDQAKSNIKQAGEKVKDAFS
jgi:uncharacterized protein YjbJ (UPF0337 family)